MVTEKRQVTPSLVDVASAEHLSKMTVSDDRVKPVSSDSARARTSAIDTADAAAEATHVTSVRRAYITISYEYVSRNFRPTIPCISKQGRRRATTQSLDEVSHAGHSHALRRPLYRGHTITHVGTRLGSPPQEGVHVCNHPR